MEQVYFKPFSNLLNPPSPQKRGLEWSQVKMGARKNWALQKSTVILLTVVAYENFQQTTGIFLFSVNNILGENNNNIQQI